MQMTLMGKWCCGRVDESGVAFETMELNNWEVQGSTPDRVTLKWAFRPRGTVSKAFPFQTGLVKVDSHPGMEL